MERDPLLMSMPHGGIAILRDLAVRMTAQVSKRITVDNLKKVHGRYHPREQDADKKT
jgi:hypothetical protein